MLEPIDTDISLIYECPQCEMRHWLNEDEVRLSPDFVCCGKLYKIKPVKVRLDFREHKPNSIVSNRLRDVLECEGTDVVTKLRGLGYDRSKAQLMVSEAIKDTKTSEDLMKNALSKDI